MYYHYTNLAILTQEVYPPSAESCITRLASTRVEAGHYTIPANKAIVEHFFTESNRRDKGTFS